MEIILSHLATSSNFMSSDNGFTQLWGMVWLQKFKASKMTPNYPDMVNQDMLLALYIGPSNELVMYDIERGIYRGHHTPLTGCLSKDAGNFSNAGTVITF